MSIGNVGRSSSTQTPTLTGTTPATPASATTPSTTTATGDAFALESSGTAAPKAEDGLTDRAKSAFNNYIHNRTRVTTGAISAGRVGLSGVGMLLRGTPVVGSVINAASALLSAARATVDTVARVRGKDGIETADVVADWARVATDIGGIFFPPVGLAGSIGSTAYLVYDTVDDAQKDAARGPKSA